MDENQSASDTLKLVKTLPWMCNPNALACLFTRERERDVGIICVIIYDDPARVAGKRECECVRVSLCVIVSLCVRVCLRVWSWLTIWLDILVHSSLSFSIHSILPSFPWPYANALRLLPGGDNCKKLHLLIHSFTSLSVTSFSFRALLFFLPEVCSQVGLIAR